MEPLQVLGSKIVVTVEETREAGSDFGALGWGCLIYSTLQVGEHVGRLDVWSGVVKITDRGCLPKMECIAIKQLFHCSGLFRLPQI